MKTIKVDKVILYYMDRVDPDGNLYRFYVYKGMASEIEYFCTEEAGNMTIPIGEGKYVKIVPKEFMKEVGYDLMTTFWEDFSIADKYGIAGVKDTYRRAFSEWKDDYKFFTELTLVLDHKIWQHYESNRELAALYDRLWREADEYAMNNFKGEELDYYYRVTD